MLRHWLCGKCNIWIYDIKDKEISLSRKFHKGRFLVCIPQLLLLGRLHKVQTGRPCSMN
jgi:hypothetical protein